MSDSYRASICGCAQFESNHLNVKPHLQLKTQRMTLKPALSCSSPLEQMKEIKPCKETTRMSVCSSQCVRFVLCYSATSFLPVTFRCLFTGLVLLVWLIVYQSISVSVFPICAITVNLCLWDRKEKYYATEPDKTWRKHLILWDELYFAKLNSNFMLSMCRYLPILPMSPLDRFIM